MLPFSARSGQRRDIGEVPRDLRGIRVLETWIGGQKIYDASPAAERRAGDAPGR